GRPLFDLLETVECLPSYFGLAPLLRGLGFGDYLSLRAHFGSHSSTYRELTKSADECNDFGFNGRGPTVANFHQLIAAVEFGQAIMAAVEPAPAKKANAARVYVRGPQPAMYRDPKSGATWSGRGRAPAWLATVRDRTKFLIDGTAAAPAAASKTNEPKREAIAVAKKALAKKVVAKKATAKNVTAKKATVKAAVQVAPTAEKTAAAKKAPAKKSSVTSKKAAAKKTLAAPAKKVAEVAVKRTSAKKVVAKKAAAVKESASADVVAASTGDVTGRDVAVAMAA
ncbi:H-NS family nucleoid-associated regulatory protein, partial [Paraburkholderia sediminicola]